MRNFRKYSNKKYIVVAVFLLLTISIGYAALSTTLTINGTANISSNSWLVYFTNVQITSGSVTATTTPTTTGTSTTSLTWEVSMDTPGQFYEYTVDVKNDGTIDAMIGSLSNTSLTSNQAKYLDYTVTYSDGAVIEQYDKLTAGGTVKLKVRVEYKTDLNPEDLPSEGATVSLTYTSNYVQADENAKDRNIISTLNIGDTVNYTTTMNGVTLDSWKVFSIDGNYTTIILADCLPNSAINTTSSSFFNLHKSDIYGIYANDNRIQLLDAMTTKENWTSLLVGTINGIPIDYSGTTDMNIWAMGSPTLDLWINSWNTKYPDDMIYTTTTASAMSDGLDGNYVGLSENPTKYRLALSSKEGYNNALYFPHQLNIGNYNAYWLASPSAYSIDNMVEVNENGSIDRSKCIYTEPVLYDNPLIEYDFNYIAARPVISLPSNIVQ